MARPKTARKQHWRRLGGGLALALLLGGCETDANSPRLNQQQSVHAAAQESPRIVIEKRLRAYADAQAHDIAKIYAHTPGNVYPGVRALGWQLLFEELDKPWQPFDFERAVRHNPVFWQAAVELAPNDISLPFLYASLAILAKEYGGASRVLTMAQATLPLTPTIRRIFATPESLLNYREQLFLADIPSFDELTTPEDCERYAVIVRVRAGLEPASFQLRYLLIELEAKRALLQARAAAPPWPATILDQRIGERLGLAPEVAAKMTTADPLFANALNATMREWLLKSTLLQKWNRWFNYFEPADSRAVEACIEVYSAAGRGDLAWMLWRGKLGSAAFVSANERMRWAAWSTMLLGPPATAKFVEESRLPLVGTGLLPIAAEGPSEAWSGDQQVHPLVAIKIERYIGMIDAMLAGASRGSQEEGELRISRAQQLAEVRAFAGARREIDRAEQILGKPEKLVSLRAALLSDEGNFVEAEKLFQQLRAVKLPGLVTEFRYGYHLYRRNDYPAARAQFHGLAVKAAWDASMAIMADLAARRSGTRELELVRMSVAHAVPESWDEAGLKFLLGDLTEEQLIEATRRDSEFEMLQRQCEAYFWLSQVALGEQRQGDAIRWLERCLNTGFTAHLEYWLARDELKRLAPAKMKEHEPREPEGAIIT